jgi:hypothetical protein
MITEEILKIAENYFQKKGIPFVKPGSIERIEGEMVEVVFLMPEALDPNCVIDPPDNRVWVNIKTKEVIWIEQM